MIKFFFNRFSKMVAIMEAAGIILAPVAAWRIFAHAGTLAQALFIAVIMEYGFIRYCATRRWYKDAPRYAGIELQFRKAIVPTSYIMAILGAILIIFPGPIPIMIAVILLAVIAHVNVILIYLHYHDTDTAPPNFFSSPASANLRRN